MERVYINVYQHDDTHTYMYIVTQNHSSNGLLKQNKMVHRDDTRRVEKM